MSIASQIASNGIALKVYRATRTVDATGSTIETWAATNTGGESPTEIEYNAVVVLQGGDQSGSGKDRRSGGKETRQQSARVIFEGAPDVKFSDRLVWTEPVRGGTLTFEIRSVTTPQYRIAGDALQHTIVLAEEVRQG